MAITPGAIEGQPALLKAAQRLATLGALAAVALLGHASPEVTRQVYLHAVPDVQRRAVKKVEKAIFGPKWTQVAPLVAEGSSLVQ